MPGIKSILRRTRTDPFGHGFAILTLALALGTTSVMLATIWGLLVRPLSGSGMDRLVYISGLSDPGFEDAVAWWSQLKSARALASFSTGRVSVGDGDQAANPVVSAISPGFFQVFGLRTASGRPLSESDEASAARVAVVSRDFWRNRLGATPTLATSFIRIRGILYQVVGVMPAGFSFPGSTSVWVPRQAEHELGLDRTTQEPLPLRAASGWVARLTGGATRESLAAEAGAILGRMNSDLSPRTHRSYGEFVSVYPLVDFISGRIRPVLIGLLTAAGLVMAVAVTNVAVLFLSRIVDGKSAAIRAAMGASPARLAREFATEAMAFTALSGLAGCAIALVCGFFVQRAVLAQYSAWLAESPAVSRWILLACICLTALAGIATGIMVAFSAASLDPVSSLQRPPLGIKPGGAVYRRISIVVEISLACALLTVADLFITSAIQVQHTPPGFNPGNLLAGGCDLSRLLTPAEQPYPRLQAILGLLCDQSSISAAAASSSLPLSGGGIAKLYLWSGRFSRSAIAYSVSADYFRTLDIPIVAGRGFLPSDGAAMAVSETLARQLWPDGNFAGHQLRLDGEPFPRDVVGVVGDVQTQIPGDHPEPQIYLPLSHPFLSRPVTNLRLVARCRSAAVNSGSCTPAALAQGALRGATYGWTRYGDLKQRLTAPLELRAYVLSAFAFCASLIAFAGVFATASYNAAGRAFEAAVHGAMGARPFEILVMLLDEVIACAAGGLVLGSLLAAALAVSMRSLIFGLTPFEPASYARAAALLMLGALAGGLAPSLRVARTEVGQALRSRLPD